MCLLCGMDAKYTNIHDDKLDGLRRRDRQSQLQIYKLYYKAMFNVSFRILNNQQDAEDAMQEAFLNAFQKIDQYNYESSFGSWLKRIVVNKSLDILERRKNIVCYDIDKLNNTQLYVVDNELDILLNIDEGQLAEIIKNYLQLIPERQRIAFSLSVFDEYDHEEIAEMMGTTINNIRSLISRSKEKLKIMILKNGDLARKSA